MSVKRCLWNVAAAAALISALTTTGSASADELAVKITEQIPSIVITYHGEPIRVMRVQDTEHQLSGGFTKTSRECPPFCFQPERAAPGVTTVGEVEVIEFMRDQYTKGTGLIVDARVPSWYSKGTIPGSVNVPFTTFEPTQGTPEQLDAAMKLFGVRAKTGKGETGFWDRLFGDDEASPDWDFSQAKALLLFCNGAWCGQSPAAIHGLLKLGYPPAKLFYYRGGMQMWQLGGFTTIVPKDAAK